MTNDRKSEQEPWDEEAALDEDDRPTQVVPPPEDPVRRAAEAGGGGDERAAAAQAQAAALESTEDAPSLAEGAPSRSAADHEGTPPEAASVLTAARASSEGAADAPAIEATGRRESDERETPVAGAVGREHGPEAGSIEDAVTTLIARDERLAESEPVEAVTRFIAEPPSPTTHPELKLASPRRSLTALQLVDADEAGEPPEQLEIAVPPTLPPAARERGEELPSMMLGAPISTRGDITQRVTTIPKTHPLANSIAPGGSLVSTPPAPVKRRSRGYAVAAAVALLGLAAGTSRLLESRGEHHAASGLPRQASSAESASEPRTPPAQDRAPPSESPSGEASRGGPSEQAQPSASAVSATAEKAARNGMSAADREALRVAVGHVQMRPRSDKTDRFRFDDGSKQAAAKQEPERAAVIAAMNRLSEPLRRCVGDEHGVADVTLTVRAPGVVSHALVEGKFAGSEKGSCIARTLRSAKLPRLAKSLVRIEYPFQL